MKRVTVLVDGFNLYHALLRFNDNRLKWLDLSALSRRLIAPQTETITSISYFSAIAHWLPGPAARHREYLKALQATGVEAVLGHFKNKDRRCRSCGATWVGHEEKETDVNIALHLLKGAYSDEYDKALLVTRDSDLVPAVAMVRSEFPNKEIVAVAPPLMGHSSDLLRVCSGRRKITPDQVKTCLLPPQILDEAGRPIVTRPREYG